ncbi:MAG TPA: LacI family DNA-binding transcriptional regulator [Candidatus Sulfopaludibacter sp.]|jgi:LacI family transcriptional regulator|nr:LacI family DNA-binding transcriptional regulator [Candidatus Sulfopaludibacter sp.]
MANTPTAPVRLKDIARDLDVSVMTVSKVVRNCPDVGAETRSRVLARIKELNYQPNWVARSLAARRTFMIGVIVPDLMHSFFAEIAKGISASIRPFGYDVVICNSEEDAELEASEIDRLLGRQVDGLILASAQRPASADVFDRIEARGVPYVLIDRRFPDRAASYVGADDEAIGMMATNHLIERGCRRIAHISGPQPNPGSGRLKGYRAALRAADLSMPKSYIVPATDDASGYEATRRLLALEPRPDGIFGYNDPTAAGAMKAILQAGIRIPEEIKVIGAGNVHYSDLLRVPLSTVDQASTRIGQQAADLLAKAIGAKRKEPASTLLIEPTLIARESTR